MKFSKAVDIILEMEGGYVNDPQDPGGETNLGISKRAYPDTDIKNLTKEKASEIYKKDYWDACFCDSLPEVLRLIVFDCAVNQGSAFASKTLQKTVGAKRDGVIGPKTLIRINLKDVNEVVESFSKERLRRYMINPNFKRFGNGWIDRLIKISIRTIGGKTVSENIA